MAMALEVMDTVGAALAVTDITGAVRGPVVMAIGVMDTVAGDPTGAATDIGAGGIMAVAGAIHSTDSASVLGSATIPIYTDIHTTILRIRTMRRIRITRRIHTAGMDTRIRPIRRPSITNTLTPRHRPVRKMPIRRRRRTAI
jgi:hypothetical protein